MYTLPAGGPIEMRPVTEAEISMVNSRDFDGDYPYLGLFTLDHKNSLDAQCFVEEDQIAAYGLAGVAEREGKRIGEVGMIHVSPAVRGLGLGSLMGLILRERLLFQQPDVLETKIGDDSGKVEHLVRLLGFEFKGISDGAGRHPIWARSFSSVEERGAFGAFLNEEIDKRLKTLKGRSTALVLKAPLDKDNPLSTDIENVVDERLKVFDTSNPSAAITYFGFVGAPVRIARSVANGDFGYSIMLDLKGIEASQILQLLEGCKEDFKVSTLDGYQQGATPTLRVSAPLTHSIEQLDSHARQFATIANKLFADKS